MSNGNILLVGATGTIGNALAKQMSENKIHCRCLVRDANSATYLKKFGMELVVGDLSIPSTLAAALDGIEKAFVCTPLSPNQVELQGNLVLACKGANVKHLVKISTLGSNPRSPLPFSQWHGLTEQKIRDLQIPYTFLHPHYFMQNTLMFKQSMNSASAIFTPLSDARISLVDSDDIAAVAFAVLTTSGHENKTYEVTGPEALSFNEIAQVFSQLLGRPIEHLTMPYDLTEKSMRENGTPEWLTGGMLKLYRFFDTGDAAFIRPTVNDIAKKRPTTFKQFAERYAEYFRTQI